TRASRAGHRGPAQLRAPRVACRLGGARPPALRARGRRRSRARAQSGRLRLAPARELPCPHGAGRAPRAERTAPAGRGPRLATALGQDPAAEAALRRALVLSPWSPEVRDRLALQLWARGERQEGTAELEESMLRFPSLSSHAYLSPASEREHQGLADDDPSGRLAALDAEMAEAIGRGLERALGSAAGGERTAIVEDLASMLEARGPWRGDAAALTAEEGRNAGANRPLARAARDTVQARAKT